jgi:hypothetical protein
MEQSEKILDSYKNSHTDDRLSLFLAYRDLRESFMAIELQEEAIPAKQRTPVRSHASKHRSTFSPVGGCREVIRRCLSRA